MDGKRSGHRSVTRFLDTLQPPAGVCAGLAKAALEIDAEDEAIGRAEAEAVFPQVTLAAAVFAVAVGSRGFQDFGDDQLALAPAEFRGETGLPARHGEGVEARVWRERFADERGGHGGQQTPGCCLGQERLALPTFRIVACEEDLAFWNPCRTPTSCLCPLRRFPCGTRIW